MILTILFLIVVIGFVAFFCNATPDNANLFICFVGLICVLVFEFIRSINITGNVRNGNISINKKVVSRCVVSSFIMLVVLVILSSYSRVDTGHTGILVIFGKVQDKTYEAGVHFRPLWANMIQMDNRIQKNGKNDEPIELCAFSKDLQEVSIKYTLNYQIHKESASNLYKTVGIDYWNILIAPTIQESVKMICAKYTAEELVGDRSKFAQGIEDDLTEKLNKFNIDVVATNIEDMDFSDAFTNAVEQKQVATQEKLKAEQEAEKQKIMADANAYVKIKEAEGEAEANELKQKSISDNLIKYEMVQKWNGVLPQVEGSATPIIDMK